MKYGTTSTFIFRTISRLLLGLSGIGLVVIIFVPNLNAQSCDMAPYFVSESGELDQSSVFTIALDNKSDQIRKAIVQNGRFVFEKIQAGKYVFISRLSGFKTTISSVEVDCTDWSVGRRVSTEIVLCGGRTEEIFVPVSSVARVPSPDRFTRTHSISSICLGADQKPVTLTPPTRVISGGVLTGKALILPKPAYPPAARAVRADGFVTVQVIINEEGMVTSATAASGHPLLRRAAEAAARGAKFTPTLLEGKPVRVTGTITYSFVPPQLKQEEKP